MEIDDFFNTDQPLTIAKRITKGSELSCDLVAHVYLIMRDKPTPNNIGASFNVIASKQWRWHNSEFNRTYHPKFTTEFDETYMSIEDEQIIHLDEYREFLSDYISAPGKDPVDWFVKEIAKLVLDGKTYRQIQEETKVNTSQITKAIKKFKDDVFDHFNSDCN
tara:strand:+ start:5648 stop:6136 length:489 start_codon:yes stop_codon:yes gene_type:complete